MRAPQGCQRETSHDYVPSRIPNFKPRNKKPPTSDGWRLRLTSQLLVLLLLLRARNQSRRGNGNAALVVVVELHFVVRFGAGHWLLVLRTETGFSRRGQQRLLRGIHGFVQDRARRLLGHSEYAARISIGVSNPDVV